MTSTGTTTYPGMTARILTACITLILLSLTTARGITLTNLEDVHQGNSLFKTKVKRSVTDVDSSSSEYITYMKGSLPIILGAPHGGYEEPSHIPDRDAGCWDGRRCVYRHNCGEKDFDRCKATTVRDMLTQELTLLLREVLYGIYGLYPHVVINELRRTKLDANRDVDEASFGEPDAVSAWEEFHNCIDQSKKEIGGTGLYIDVHGHGHATQWAELGYLFSGHDLDSDNIDPEKSSIRNLANNVDVSFEELLRGETSFGGYLQDLGFMSVPSHEHPGPEGKSYFSGGYNTRVHGSRDGGEIDAIQIESPRTFREDELREQYASALGETIRRYIQKHYDYPNDKSTDPKSGSSPSTQWHFSTLFSVVVLPIFHKYIFINL